MTFQESYYLENKGRTIFITHSMSGHRVNWFRNLHEAYNRQGKSMGIITLENEQHNSKLMDCTDVSLVASKIDALKLADELHAKNRNTRFVILDGETWLFYLFLAHFPVKVLFLRPFVSNSTPRSALFFFLKRCIIELLRFKQKLDYRFLSIPFYKPLMSPGRWVQDDLSTLDIDTSKFSKQNDLDLVKILIPGFISHRKSPRLILETAAELESKIPGRFQFIFLGQIESDVKHLLQSANLGSIQFIDSYLDRLEYLRQINNADFVLLLYKNRGASGVLLESLLLNTSLILKRDRIWSNLVENSPDSIFPLLGKRSDISGFLMNFTFQNRSTYKFDEPQGFKNNLRDTNSLIQFIVSD